MHASKRIFRQITYLCEYSVHNVCENLPSPEVKEENMRSSEKEHKAELREENV
jgi:hypothetical protein